MNVLSRDNKWKKKNPFFFFFTVVEIEFAL